MIKKDSIMTRIEKGNSLADKVANYLNVKFGYQFEKASIEDDRNLMIDYRCSKHNKTAQFKCRDNQSDIIYEAFKFIPKENGLFETVEGRDVRTKSDFYICLSSDKKTIVVATTEKIKEIVKKSISLENLDNIQNTYNDAKTRKNKSKFLKSNSKHAEICFKIDEGKDTREYGKLLIFIPCSSIPDSIVIELKPNEDILKESSWK